MFAVVITEKGGAQRRMEFDKNEVTIGRVQGNDIILPKGNVSKRHSRIVLKDNRFIVVDLKSTNGTYVNGRKITSPLVVKPGDKVYIGDFIMTVEGLDGDVASASMAPQPMGAGGPPPMPQPSGPPMGSPPPMPAPQPSAPPPMPAPQPSGPPPMPQPMAQPAPQPAPQPMAPQPMAPQPMAPQPAPMPAPQPAPAPAPQPAPAPAPQPAPAPAPQPAPAPAPQPAPQPTAEPVRRSPPPLRSSPPPAAAPDTPAARPRASSPRPANEPSRSEPLATAPRQAPAAVMTTPMETPEGLPAVMAALARRFPAWEDPSARVLADLAHHDEAREAVSAALGDVGADDTALAEAALAEAVGLGAFGALLADDGITEIVVEGPDRVLVDRGAGLVPSEAAFSSAAALAVCARRLVARCGGSTEGPMLQGWLPEGGFATVVLPPIAIGGAVVEIRKGVGVTLDMLVARGALSEPAAALIRNAVEARRNVVVLGTADGGVSEVLAACAAAIDPSERLIAVGAGAPLDLPNVVALSAGGAVGAALGMVAQQAARLRSDHLLVDGVADASALDVLAALGAHGGGGFVGVNAAAARDPGAVLTLLARLAGRATEEAVADLVGDVAHLVVQVERGDSGPRVSSIVELGAAQGSRIPGRTLFSSQGDVLVPTGEEPSF